MTTSDDALKMAEEANAELEPPNPNPNWVQMTHPAVHTEEGTAPASATEQAFEEVWAPRGWVQVESAEQPTNPTPAPRQSTKTPPEEG